MSLLYTETERCTGVESGSPKGKLRPCTSGITRHTLDRHPLEDGTPNLDTDADRLFPCT